MRVRRGACVVWIGLLGTAVPALSATPPTTEQMWAVIQQQQKTIEELKARLESTEQSARAAGQKAETAGKQAEAAGQQAAEASEQVEESVSAAEAKAPSWTGRTRIGGYGELHYNNWRNDTANTTKDEVDFHRFVIFLGHQFNDRIRFHSEIEIEHALIGDDDGSSFAGSQNNKPGELELEQAYIEADVFGHHRLRAGLQILPIGILNETHEPATFYGVERNLVESSILPTTWWEAGLGMSGEVWPERLPGLGYDLVVHSGLQTATTGGNAFRVRQGRQKVAEAPANDMAFTGRLKYTGLPGIEVGVAGQYQADITGSGFAEDIPASLVEAHTVIRKGPFGLRALVARWDLAGGPAATGPAGGPSDGRDVQFGWYLEPSWKFDLVGPLPGAIGIFGRYSETDNNAGDQSLAATRIERWDVGFNWWPHEDVVFKFDYQDEHNGSDNDGFNLGIGYQFF